MFSTQGHNYAFMVHLMGGSGILLQDLKHMEVLDLRWTLYISLHVKTRKTGNSVIFARCHNCLFVYLISILD